MEVWIDTAYRGGGWVLVLQNRRNTNSVSGLTYANATSYQPNHRGQYGVGTSLSSFNLLMGLPVWSDIINANPGTGQVAQFVATTACELGQTSLHTKRQYWDWNGGGHHSLLLLVHLEKLLNWVLLVLVNMIIELLLHITSQRLM